MSETHTQKGREVNCIFYVADYLPNRQSIFMLLNSKEDEREKNKEGEREKKIAMVG